MKQPVVSIIVPFYNEEKFLKRAMESVKCQTYSSIQLILVDDGSTDRSSFYAKEFCKNQLNSKLITTSNLGPGNARNVGVENATGTYISFLDADDFYHNNAIELLYEDIIKHNSDLSVGQYIMQDTNEVILKKSTWSTNLIINNKEAISFVVSEKLIPTSWGKLYKTKIAKNCSFPNLSWKEDDVFFLSYLLNSKTVSVINKSILTINCRPDSLTRQLISKQMIIAISKSFTKQTEILRPLKDKRINQYLIESEINTYLNLLILLKIDWKNIAFQKQIWGFFCTKVNVLYEKTKKHKIQLKKRILMSFLISATLFGRSYSFLLISVFKRHQKNHLKKIKS